jgi:hypothetical protein
MSAPESRPSPPSAEKDIWFPAKRYGYGWGPPVRWQGWVVLLAHVVGVALAALRLSRTRDHAIFIATLVTLTVAFLLICRWKGAPAKWRWGDE